MSFFDDDDFDEPTYVAHEGESRRASSRRPGLGGLTGGGAPPDAQTARVRQIVALGAIVFILILLTVAVNSCVKSGRKSALQDYSRDVTAVLQESRSEVADPLFDVLSSGEEANALQSRLSSIREVASDEADRVQGFSPPGDDRGKAAQHDLELAMNLRAEALRVIAQEISRALADASTSQEALDAIAGQMQALLASDVILLSRTKPLIDEALRDADVSGAEVQAPRVLTDFSWLDADGLGAKLGSGGGGGGSSSSGEVRDRSGETPSSPGLHGTSITGVTMGGTQLSAGASTAVPGRKVEVQVNNGGESDESQIEVGATFAISGGQSVSTKRVIATLAQGQTATVPLTLPAAVRSGVEGELTITVGGVPGESNMDNNKQTFQVTVGG
ncbi:hypothetical protein SK069_12675 [Patulibacter brassicae]|uniref:CARDB domain-containing protein n=1 Tax=Patulibacter brassicae TaxID=1705717 RepID=A0ABU4VKV2_9ACTN|nr:hypothetical protein [Patulibacter brassicae]MDX8152455.1 hypothetical protein [Patulibacter brassicae]